MTSPLVRNFLLCLAGIPALQVLAIAERERDCRVFYVNPPAEVAGRIFVHDGKEAHTVKLKGLSLSSPCPLPKGKLTLWFSLDEKKPAESGKSSSVVVPQEWRQVFLVIESNPEGAGPPMKVQAFDGSDAKLKPGEILWANLTDATVSGKLGEHPIELAPRAHLYLGAPISEGATYPVVLDVKGPEPDAKTRRLARSTWRFDRNAKMLALVVIDPNRGRPRVIMMKN